MTPGRLLGMILSVLMLTAGIAGTAVGAFVLVAELLSSPSAGPPTCDDKVMSPGDQCLVTVNGQSSSAGYAEMVRRREEAPRDSLIIGGTVFGGGVVLLLSGWGLARWSGKG